MDSLGDTILFFSYMVSVISNFQNMENGCYFLHILNFLSLLRMQE